MKDRSMRRHQDFKTKIKNKKIYNSCIKNLSSSERSELENNVEKLKKICVANHQEDVSRKTKKTLQEMKHDITMREQLKKV